MPYVGKIHGFGIALVLVALAGCVAAPLPEPSPIPSTTADVAPKPSPTPEILDLGAREGATGTVEVNANGTPYLYTVAAGDYPDAICYRFNLYSEQLVFHDSGEPVWVEIYPGDVIRFEYYEPSESP